MLMRYLDQHRLPILLVAIAVAALTMFLQSYNIGFWGWRHGWTSSHSLSIIRRAVPENRFVGYALAFREADGAITYDYFDRYPVFFSAAMNALLSPIDALPAQIYAARQIMNGLLLLTLFVAYRLARLYLNNRLLAIAATIFAFSSYYFLYYKDMPDFHPPVVLSFLALSYAVARYRLYHERTQLYLVAAAAVLLAFGYAVMFALALWLLLCVINIPLAPHGRLEPRRWLRDLLRLDALWITLIGTLLSAGAIAYNVSAEAAVRGVSLAETSVVDSILRRIPFLEGAVVDQSRDQIALSGLVGWGQFFIVQFERLIKWSLPLKTGGETGIRFIPGESEMQVTWWIVALGVPLTAWLIRFIIRQPPPRREVALLTVLAPVVFLFSMINLTSVHDFVTMFGMGFSVMLWTALLAPLDHPPRTRWAAARPYLVTLLALALYAGSAYWVRVNQNIELIDGVPYTEDFERIRQTLPARHHTIFLDYNKSHPECVIRDWQCFALGYYLGNNYLTVYPNLADYALSAMPYYVQPEFVDPNATLNLALTTTPENTVTHLFDLNTMQPRTAPAPDPAFRFGEHVEMGDWGLIGTVNLRACERVGIESWWRVTRSPATNYNMQIVMVNPNGGAITESNLPLGRVPTRLWELNRYALDVRPLQVPCDTPPGTYPLIMGVYDPDTLAPLPAFTPAGDPVGNQIYLTTVTVE